MHLLIAASVAVTLLGCGQKGPLVLPDAQHPHKKIGVGKPPAAPATLVPPVSPPSSVDAPLSSKAPLPAGSAPLPQP